MSDRCEWEDGKYAMCEIMYNYMTHDTEAWKNSCMMVNKARWDFCPFCGTDIRKPEEKLLPKDWPKERWIAFYNAVKEFME